MSPKRHQHGVPLEQTASARKAVSAEDTVYFRDTAYREDARRFDMGERDHFIGMEMASIGMEMMAGWGSTAIVERLSMLTGKLADGLGQSRRPSARSEAAGAAYPERHLSQGHGAGPAAAAGRGERSRRPPPRPAAHQPARLQ